MCDCAKSLDWVLRWDEQRRTWLSRCLDADTADAAGQRLRAFIAEALTFCHPNHNIVLQARLMLVAFGFGGSVQLDGDAAAVRSRLAAVDEALAQAERLLPVCDSGQLADLFFTKGLTHHRLAHFTRTTAGTTAAAYELRAAAAAMLRSARAFSESSSEGADARPCAGTCTVVKWIDHTRSCVRRHRTDVSTRVAPCRSRTRFCSTLHAPTKSRDVVASWRGGRGRVDSRTTS
jgi:hypothetical protein